MTIRFMTLSFTVLLISALALVAFPDRAAADPFEGSCRTKLDALDDAIETAVFLGRNSSSRSNLIAKLEAAAAKLSLGKLADAVDKLLDISEKATVMATANKPKLEDATNINSAVAEAIGCVSAP